MNVGVIGAATLLGVRSLNAGAWRLGRATSLPVGLLLFVGSIVLAAQSIPILPRPQPVALTRANVVNVSDGSIQSNVTVFIRGANIESVGAGAPPSDAKVIDVSGAYVLPGLIDGHTHLSDFAAAKRALESGITTVRSAGMGGVGGATLADIGLRELARTTDIAAPEMFAAGYQLRPRLPVDMFLLWPRLAALDSGLTTDRRRPASCKTESLAAGGLDQDLRDRGHGRRS
jgi:hypothetical protein